MRIGPPGNIAGRKYARRTGLKTRIDQNAPIGSEPGRFGESDPRPHADAGNDHVCGYGAAAAQLDLRCTDARHGIPKVEDDAIFFMQAADEFADLRPQYPFHWPFVGRYHMHFDAAGPKGSSNLKANKAGAQNDGAACGTGLRDDLPTVGKRAQGVDMRLVGAGDGQANRFGAHCQQQSVEGDPSPIGEQDLAGADVDASNPGSEAQVDAVLGIEVLLAQRDPLLRRLTAEIVLRKVRAVDGQRLVIADHDDGALKLFAPQPLGGGKASGATPDDDDLFGSRPGIAFAWGRRVLLALLANDYFVAALFNRPACERR